MLKRPLNFRSSVFIKNFLSYILVFTIPLFTIGIISYYWAVENIREQTEKAYINAVDDVKNNIDKKFGTLATLSIQLSKLKWVEKIMCMEGSIIDQEKVDPYNFINYINDLKTYQAFNEFINDMGIYFNNKDTVVSTSSKSSMTTFFEDAFHFENLRSEEWEHILSQYNNANILYPSDVVNYFTPKRFITYIQSLPVGDKTFQATFLAFIDENTFKGELKSTASTKDGSLYVIDPGSNKFVTGVNYDENIIPILTGKSYADSFSAMNTGKLTLQAKEQHSVFYSSSSINGWVYVYTIPTNIVMNSANNIKLATLVISFLSLIAGFFISYYLALKNYTPLSNLISIINPTILNNSQIISNEYNFLQKTLHTMLEYEEKTQKEIELYKPLARNSFFIRLLKGPIDDKFNFTKILDISFENTYFTCLSVLFETESTLTERLQSGLSVMLSEYKASVFFIEIGSKHKVILLNTAYEQQIEQLVGIMEEYFKDISIEYKAIGVGKTYSSLHSISQSLSESNSALDYRFLKGNNCVIYSKDIVEDSKTSYDYPSDKAEHIANNIKCGDYKNAINCFRDVTFFNINNKRISPVAVRYLFYSISITAAKVLEDMSISFNEPFHLDDLLCMDSIDDMVAFVEELFHRTCDIIKREKAGKKLSLQKSVLEYIDTNYNDNNLTLSSTADFFNVSPTFLSRFIKDHTGMSFTDYLNKCRIEASKDLLKCNKTVIQIALEVGFGNDITFRRLFKKYLGITPGEYKNS